MKTLNVALIAALFVSVASAHEHPSIAPNPLFDRLKQLKGSWEGTHKTEKGEEKISLKYDITSGGSAMLETLMTGKPEEMISVYHSAGKDLLMTHYCAIGNQPTMKVKKSDATMMDFSFDHGTGFVASKDPHMHELKVTMPSNNELVQEWTFYEKGKPTSTEVFSFHRVK